jgi:hypothetical protein
MAAFWAVFTFGGSGPALTAHGSLDLKQEIQIQIQIYRHLIKKPSHHGFGRHGPSAVKALGNPLEKSLDFIRASNLKRHGFTPGMRGRSMTYCLLLLQNTIKGAVCVRQKLKKKEKKK